MRLLIPFLAVVLAPTLVSAMPTNGTTKTGLPRQFSDHSVYRIYPASKEELLFLQSLLEHMPGCDVWKLPRQFGQPMDIMVDTAAHGEWLEKTLTEAEYKWEVMVSNVQELMDAETADSDLILSEVGDDGIAINIQTFNTHDDINAWLEALAAHYPSLCEVIHLGSSYEGRDMKMIRIGSDRDRESIWIDGGIHSREWITIATSVWFIHKLLGEYEEDNDIREMVDSFNWYINPVFNPDGYQYSRTTERLWRKTRSRPQGAEVGWPQPSCVGADPDRNWDVAWGEFGSSTDECSDIYAGEAAMSERCVSASAAHMRGLAGGGLRVYMALHSYGQLWMHPYAHTANVCPDCLELANLGRSATHALSQLYGTRYLVGSTEELLHPFSGSSVDYAYTELGVKYSFYIELRDNGRYGFIIPSSMIPETSEETWSGVQTVARAILDRK